MNVVALERCLREVVAARAHWLEGQFGFSGLDVAIRTDPVPGIVHLSGTVLGWHECERLTSAIYQTLPRGWELDSSRLAQHRTGDWRALPPGATLLWREQPAAGRECSLASEILPDDGPVEVLASIDTTHLVRTEARLMGWTTGALGPKVDAPAPVVAHPHVPQELAQHAVAFSGVPYALGGTTEAGMDCSGLVFRAVRRAFGRSIHRHSLDQVAGADGDCRQHLSRGHLVLVHPAGRLPHVGIVTSDDGADPDVVHASAVRGEVVVEPLTSFLGDEPLIAAGPPCLG